MNKIHLVMPMGGAGTRFGNKGFNLPKPLIQLQGRPFFYWAVQSVRKYVDLEDIIFVVLKEHVDRFEIDKIIIEIFPGAIIRVIPEVLNGAVLTCMEGANAVNDELPLLFNDCDHAFISESFYRYCERGEFSDIDGALLTFTSDSPNFSYVQFDAEGKVSGTIEKKVVSKEAICGAYYFKNKDLFCEGVETYLQNCEYKEFFVSGVYNELAKQRKLLSTFHVNEHISFGTPEEYDKAIMDERLKELIE